MRTLCPSQRDAFEISYRCLMRNGMVPKHFLKTLYQSTLSNHCCRQPSHTTLSKHLIKAVHQIAFFKALLQSTFSKNTTKTCQGITNVIRQGNQTRLSTLLPGSAPWLCSLALLPDSAPWLCSLALLLCSALQHFLQALYTGTFSKHFTQALYTTTSSKHFIQAPYPSTLSKHVIKELYPITLFKHFSKALYQPTLSNHFIQALYQQSGRVLLTI